MHSDMRNLISKLLLRLHRILRIDESSLTFIPSSSNKMFSQRVYLNIVEGPFQGSCSKKQSWKRERVGRDCRKKKRTHRNVTHLISQPIVIETFQVKSLRVWHLMSATGTGFVQGKISSGTQARYAVRLNYETLLQVTWSRRCFDQSKITREIE